LKSDDEGMMENEDASQPREAKQFPLLSATFRAIAPAPRFIQRGLSARVRFPRRMSDDARNRGSLERVRSPDGKPFGEGLLQNRDFADVFAAKTGNRPRKQPDLPSFMLREPSPANHPDKVRDAIT